MTRAEIKKLAENSKMLLEEEFSKLENKEKDEL